MTDDDINKFGKMAFEVYSECQDNKTFDGRDIPKWDKLPFKIREAWCVSASMVIEEYAKDMIFKIKDIVSNKPDPFATKIEGLDLSKFIPEDIQ